MTLIVKNPSAVILYISDALMLIQNAWLELTVAYDIIYGVLMHMTLHLNRCAFGLQVGSERSFQRDKAKFLVI